MSHHFLACAVALTALAQHSLFSASFDWPQWQGPDRNAASKETGLLKEWPKDGPPLAWKMKGLGGGDSTPSIAAGRIYGMSHRGEDEIVWALSEKDGKELWAARIGPAYTTSWHQSKEGPSATPTVDGDRLYVMGLAGNLVCLQAGDGKVVWQRNLMAEFGGRMPMWSYRESPLVDGDKVIGTPGGTETTMVAFNKLTGEMIWKNYVPEKAGQTAPARPENRPNVIETDLVLSSLDKDHDKTISADELAAAPTVLAALDKNKDGSLSEDEVAAPSTASGGQGRRRGQGIIRMMKSHSAMDADGDGALNAAEIKNATVALRKIDANRDGKLTEDEVGMKHFGPQETGAAYSSAIAIDFGGQRQYVQFLATTVAGVSAADGKLLWRYDKPANGMKLNISTPIYHDGHVFAASDYGAGGGLARLTKNARGEFVAEEAWFSKNMENHHGGVILHDGALFGANGKLYIRDQDTLFCYDVKAK